MEWKEWEELRNNCQKLFSIIGCGRLERTDSARPYYDVEYEYDTVRYGRLTHFVAYIPKESKVLYHSEKKDLHEHSSYTVYDCGNNYFAVFYKGNALTPSEFIVYKKTH
jgi:hypothetical protein